MSTNGYGVAEGSKRLRRVETFLDVSYAVLFVHFIMYLPRTEDMAWSDLPLGLFSLLVDNATDLLRLFIAIGLTLISWNMTHKLLDPLLRTDARHQLFVLLQLVFVCLFLFFAVSDPELRGGFSSPAGQCISLALSGFIGLAGFSYARKHGFANPRLTEADLDEVARGAMVEPTTALLNTALAFVGPVMWTLGWLVIPIGVIWVTKKLRPTDTQAT